MAHGCRTVEDQYHIFFDGALVATINGDKPVHSYHLAPELVKEMVEFAADNGIDLELAAYEGSFSERETWTARIKPVLFGHPVAIGPLSGIWERETIIRGSLTVREPGDSEKAELFTTHFKQQLTVVSAHCS